MVCLSRRVTQYASLGVTGVFVLGSAFRSLLADGASVGVARFLVGAVLVVGALLVGLTITLGPL